MTPELRWVLPLSDGRREQAALLGGKGANLAELTRMGLPVPPGLVITTEACAVYNETGELPPGLLEEAQGVLARVQDELGRRFGDTRAPLLVSVRSGAPTSMPGMMDTILNVGLCSSTFDGFASWAGSEAIARDCLSRLADGFSAAAGTELPDLPSQQLERSIATVFESWDSRRAKIYRRYHQIEDRGTAVVVQAMVFGNAGPRSGTGVAFTRNPSTGEPTIFGEYLAGGQGEDVVAGSRNVDDLALLEREEPAAYAELERFARLSERRFGDMCEIELTLERGKLWILQARRGQRSATAAVRIAVQLVQEGIIGRPEALRRVAPEMLEELDTVTLDLERLDPASVLTTATGSSPGLATGILTLSSREAIERSRDGAQVILACRDTSPEDLDGMIACKGMLTTRGGKTSHAAVVARGLGRACVCGAADVEIDGGHGLLRVDGRAVREGELVSVDGDGGRVIVGEAPGRRTERPSEADVLAAWYSEMAV